LPIYRSLLRERRRDRRGDVVRAGRVRHPSLTSRSRRMEPSLRTPLLDMFRRGEVPRDVRLLAAQGALAPRAHEQLALLMLLVGDADQEIAALADATLASIPRHSLEAFIARKDVGDDVRAFFAGRGFEPAATPAAAAESPLVDNAPAPEPLTPAASGEDGEPDQKGSTLQKIAALNVAQRLSLAMKGS